MGNTPTLSLGFAKYLLSDPIIEMPIIFVWSNLYGLKRYYNRVYFSQPVIHNYVPISPITQKDAATEIMRLHGLMEKGMITQAEFADAKRKLL